MVKIEETNNYFACEDGTIYSKTSGKKLTPRMMKNGYSKVYMTDIYGKRIERLVHRVICEAFHGKENGMACCVNHIDCNKMNNRPENLEWVSYSQNMEHASKNNLLLPQRRHMQQVNLNRRKAVIAINDNGDVVFRFSSIEEAREAGFTAVSKALKRGKKSAGLSWKLL